jgi:hypothetical protein
VVLDYITVLINDYELLAFDARHEADYCRRVLQQYKTEYEPHQREALAQEELSYRADATRFQEEADRLRGNNARRVRQTRMSAGLPGSPNRNLPDRARGSGQEDGSRNSLPCPVGHGTTCLASDEDGVLVHRPRATRHV